MRWYEWVANLCRKMGRVEEIPDRHTSEIYLKRYFILGNEKSKWFRILLHNIRLGDTDGPHDHPWAFLSIILAGGYYEWTQHELKHRRPGTFYFRGARSFHRVQLDNNKEVWTLVVSFPRMSKSWGFLRRVNGKMKRILWTDYLGIKKQIKEKDQQEKKGLLSFLKI